MVSSLNNGTYYYNNEWKVTATISIAWDKSISAKQTLFPVWGEKEDRRPRQGVPPADQLYTLRATKAVNMHPFPTITITNQDGSQHLEDEEVRLSIVGTDRVVPSIGSCNCGGSPVIGESKPFQLERRGNDTYCKIRGGSIELKKLQIGCCTGARGHGSSFCIRVEFVREGPLKGYVCYSLPIEVGAKGPFTKNVNSKRTRDEPVSQAAEPVAAQPVVQQPPPTTSLSTSLSIVPSISVDSPKLFKSPSAGQLAGVYEGACEMVSILRALNLNQYIQLFLQNEVDLQAFLQLGDEDLTQMGITKIGPKVKILKHIAKIKEEAQLNTAVTAYTPPPPTSPGEFFAALHEVANIAVPDEIIESATKKRRVDFLPSLSPCSPSLADRFAMPPPSLPLTPVATDPNNNSNSPLSLYLYLSHVTTGKNKLKKGLFLVRSKRDRASTEEIVQQVQQGVLSKLNQKGGPNKIMHEGKAQMMLILQPDKNNDWVARSQVSGQLWSFKRGDYIKIDNHHDVNVQILMTHFLINDAGEAQLLEDQKSPKKFPLLSPGCCLEIGIDDNRDGRIVGSSSESDPAETFAVTHNGKLLVTYNNFAQQTCIFSFKRKKVEMRKVESLDDFQKELFLSKCLEVDSLDNN